MTETERVLPLFPLEQVVLYPGMSLPLRIFEERYKVMIGACQVTDQLFGVLLIRRGREVGEPALPERVGCTARMLRVDRLPDGQMAILNIGEQRFRLVGPPRVMPEGYLVGDVRLLDDAGGTTAVPAELLASVREEFGKYQAATLEMSGRRQESGAAPELVADPVRVSYRIAASLHVHPRERQQLLEIDDVAARLQEELALLRRENQPARSTIGPFSVN
jgi:Lon protease-like protein